MGACGVRAGPWTSPTIPAWGTRRPAGWWGPGRVADRAAMRPLGMLTQAVHLSAWAPDGRLWIARRALDKPNDPGLWDTLAGGLVAAGEDCETALLRESREEAGLQAVEIAAHGPLR